MRFKYIYETAIALLLMILVGLFYSRFLISCGLVGLSVLWLFFVGKKNLWELWKGNALTIAAFIIAGIYIVSVIGTENYSAYWKEIKNKLPYLFIPVSMLCIPKIRGNGQHLLALVFIVLVIISGMQSLYQYLENPAVIEEAYAQGNVIPTVIHHVAYSVLLVYAVLTCLYYLFHLHNKGWRIAVLLAMIFIIYLIHLLAIRTGLICLYISVPLYLAITCIRQQRIKLLLGTLILLFIGGALLFTTTETIKNKVDYMMYDIGLIKKNINTDNELSDSRRLLSVKLGWELAMNNPWVGTGIGDVRDEMQKLYIKRFPGYKQETRGHIHNQFVHIFAACGFIFGSIFILCILSPLWIFYRKSKILLFCMYCSLLLVMLWEPFIEYQLGNTIFLLVLAFGVNQIKET